MRQRTRKCIVDNSCNLSIEESLNRELLRGRVLFSGWDQNFYSCFYELVLSRWFRKSMVQTLIFPVGVEASKMLLRKVRRHYHCFDELIHLAFRFDSVAVVEPLHNPLNCCVSKRPGCWVDRIMIFFRNRISSRDSGRPDSQIFEGKRHVRIVRWPVCVVAPNSKRICCRNKVIPDNQSYTFDPANLWGAGCLFRKVRRNGSWFRKDISKSLG